MVLFEKVERGYLKVVGDLLFLKIFMEKHRVSVFLYRIQLYNQGIKGTRQTNNFEFHRRKGSWRKKDIVDLVYLEM